MFGIVGKLVGSVAGGLLEKVGLGKIAPFVKMGLNAVTGNWLGVAKDVFGMVSGFKSNFLDKAANKPPLGGFDQAQNLFAPTNNRLNGNGLAKFFNGLSNLLKAFSGNGNNNQLDGFGKIFNAFKVLSDFFGNNQLYANRSVSFQYNELRS